MPGRGRPWRGVGQGNQDRIGSGAIADGSIQEADLDTALQAKVNAGGGAWRKIGEVTASGSSSSMLLSGLNETMTNVAEIKLAGTAFWDNNQQTLSYRINGLTEFEYSVQGTNTNSIGTVTGINNQATAWSTGITIQDVTRVAIELNLRGLIGDPVMGYLKERYGQTDGFSTTGLEYNENFSILTSIEVFIPSENFFASSKFAVYALDL